MSRTCDNLLAGPLNSYCSEGPQVMTLCLAALLRCRAGCKVLVASGRSQPRRLRAGQLHRGVPALGSWSTLIGSRYLPERRSSSPGMLQRAQISAGNRNEMASCSQNLILSWKRSADLVSHKPNQPSRSDGMCSSNAVSGWSACIHARGMNRQPICCSDFVAS